MYQSAPRPDEFDAPAAAHAAHTPQNVPPAVYWIGLTSMLTDISSEMVAAVLPVFMFSVLHLSALQVGFLDGLYQGAAALVRLVFAYAADKYQALKATAVMGYTLSVLARALLLLSMAGGMLFVLLALLLDRVGKGVRSAPRDALIAHHAGAARLRQAFGVHRSLDAAGALAGPLLATLLLWWWVDDYRVVFACSVLFGLLGLAVIAFKVAAPKRTVSAADSQSHGIENAAPLDPPRLGFRVAVETLCRQKAYLHAMGYVALLALFTVSDGLFYLSVQQRLGLPHYAVALMFSASGAVFMLSAVFFGRISFRVRSKTLVIFAYGLLLALYIAWGVWRGLAPENVPSPGVELGQITPALLGALAIGIFYGASDGALTAHIIKQLPSTLLATGLALFLTVVGVAKIASSSLYGWLWHTYSDVVAQQVFAVGLALALWLAADRWRPDTPQLA